MAQDTNSPTACPECGALPIDGMTCWEQLVTIIAWEYQDADLRAEHFLTVTCYNLQHPAQFTDEALADLRIALVDRLDRGVPVEELRRRVAGTYEGKKQVLKDVTERRPVLRPWSVTIADVYRSGVPAGAAERVRAWAAAVQRAL